MLQIVLLSLFGCGAAYALFDQVSDDDNDRDDDEEDLETLVGTDGDDSLVGGDGAEFFAGAGDDIVSAEEGSYVDGGTGDDWIRAGDYSELIGGEGNDTIGHSWGGANSTLHGGEGDDQLNLGSGSIGFGDEGNDSLAGRGNTTLHGGEGDDIHDTSLFVDEAPETTAFGEEGNDTLFVQGGGGDGGVGNDTLIANLTPQLVDAFGLINLTGGEGTDTFIIQPSYFYAGLAEDLPTDPLVTITDFDPTTEQLLIDQDRSAALVSLDITPAADGSYTDVTATFEINPNFGEHDELSIVTRLEGVSSLSEDSISIVRYADDAVLSPNSGTDGNDTMTAGSGEIVLAGDGNDLVTSDANGTSAHLGAGEDAYVSTGNNTIIHAGAGNDSITLQGDEATATGGAGDDTITASGDGTTAYGGGGNDTFIAERGSGANTFYGGDGENTYEIGLGDTARNEYDGGSEVTLNVFPEDLGNDPAYFWVRFLPSNDITLNLPPEITGELSISSEEGFNREDGGFMVVTISTESGQDLLTINTAPYEDVTLDDFTINRDVTF